MDGDDLVCEEVSSKLDNSKIDLCFKIILVGDPGIILNIFIYNNLLYFYLIYFN